MSRASTIWLRCPASVGPVSLIVCLAVLSVPHLSGACPPVTARQVALRGTGAAGALGVEAIWANPANLAAPDRPAFSLMLLSAVGNEACAAAIDNETFWQLVAFKAEPAEAELEPIAA